MIYQMKRTPGSVNSAAHKMASCLTAGYHWFIFSLSFNVSSIHSLVIQTSICSPSGSVDLISPVALAINSCYPIDFSFFLQPVKPSLHLKIQPSWDNCIPSMPYVICWLIFSTESSGHPLKWYYCYFLLLLAWYNTLKRNKKHFTGFTSRSLVVDKAYGETTVMYLWTLLSSSVQVTHRAPPPPCPLHTCVPVGRKTRGMLQRVPARSQFWTAAVLGLWGVPQHILPVLSRCSQRTKYTERREEGWDF